MLLFTRTATEGVTESREDCFIMRIKVNSLEDWDIWELSETGLAKPLVHNLAHSRCLINSVAFLFCVAHINSLVHFRKIPALSKIGLLTGCCYSVTKLCPTFCNPMDCSMPGFSSVTVSQSLLKFMSIELVETSNHLILCHPLFLLPSVFLSISVFSSESGFCIRWPKYWSLGK